MLEFLKKQRTPGPADPQLLEKVKQYIDAHYEPEDVLIDLAMEESVCQPEIQYAKKKTAFEHFSSAKNASYDMSAPAASPAYGSAAPKPRDLDDYLRRIDAGFSETLLKLIDRTGEKDSTIYKRANVDRKLFSKIRSNPEYRPSKSTALAFALALELDLEETNDLIGRAGYVLSRSSMADTVVECFIENRIYDIDRLNEVLYSLDLPLLGGA